MTAVTDDGPGGVRFLDEWTARQQQLQQPATPGVPFAPRGPRPNYVAKAVDDECRQVREAAKGTRNAQLNTSALKLGRLVGSGLLDEAEARDALAIAARAAGLEIAETWRTIASGMRAGLASPRDPGEPQSNGGRRLRELGPAGPGVVGAAVPGTSPGPAGTDTVAAYLQPAGTWLAALPEQPQPVWGDAEQVLWSEGEALMVCGGPGLGKTNLAAQLVRARIGWAATVLELPVTPGARRVLYLMMDRPRQIARRLRQQFSTDELGRLDERMTLGVGPPPADMARHPELLADLCASAGADTVVVDSLKDAALGLTDDETGAGYNRARQLAVTAGVQVLELHHLVKRGSDGKAPTTLADVYGSAWLTAGAGSVLLLTGDAGDPVVHATHLKQPLEAWGPAELSHDHGAGRTTIHHRSDPVQLLAVTGVQTARSLAVHLFTTERPRPAQVETARRKLEALCRTGMARRFESGGETRYQPATARPLRELNIDPLED